jgi:hypothetical protein
VGSNFFVRFRLIGDKTPSADANEKTQESNDGRRGEPNGPFAPRFAITARRGAGCHR